MVCRVVRRVASAVTGLEVGGWIVEGFAEGLLGCRMRVFAEAVGEVVGRWL